MVVRYGLNESTANAAASTSASVCGEADEALDCRLPAVSKGLPPPLWSFVTVGSLEPADEVDVLVSIAEGAALVSMTMLDEADVAAAAVLLDVGVGLELGVLSLEVLEALETADVDVVSISRLEATDVALLAVTVLAAVVWGVEVGVLDGACVL